MTKRSLRDLKKTSKREMEKLHHDLTKETERKTEELEKMQK